MPDAENSQKKGKKSKSKKERDDVDRSFLEAQVKQYSEFPAHGPRKLGMAAGFYLDPFPPSGGSRCGHAAGKSDCHTGCPLRSAVQVSSVLLSRLLILCREHIYSNWSEPNSYTRYAGC